MPVKEDPTKVKVESDEEESSIDDDLLFLQFLSDVDASRKLECCYCNYTTRRKMDLEVHIQKEHKMIDAEYKCYVCSYTTTQLPYIKAHIPTHSSVTFKCDYCNYTAKRKADLKSHMWRHNTSAVECKCDKCLFTTKMKHYVKNHLSVYQVNKKYHCPYCDWTGTWYGSLRQHLTRHSSNVIKDVSTIGTEPPLQRHCIKHNAEKHPYKCNYYEYTKKMKDNLNPRLMKRVGEMLKSNEFCYATEYKKHLKQHPVKYTKNNTFNCDKCEYKTFAKHYLTCHQVIHTDEKEFKCDRCSYKSQSRINLQTHIKNDH